MIVDSNDMKWQEAEKGYPPGTKMKLLRDDEDGRTVILQLPKGFNQREIHIEKFYIVFNNQQKKLDGFFG